MKYVLLLIAALTFAAPASAEEYEKGPNGGLVTINVFVPNPPKPVSTKGFTAAVLIAGGSGRETVTLSPQGENSLKGDAKAAIPAGATITLTIKTAEGKSGQAKFKK